MYPHAFVILCSGMLLLASNQEDDAKKELAKMQGTWRVVSVVINGEKLKDEDIKDDRLIIKGTKFTLQGKKQLLDGALTLDPSKSPKHLNALAAGADLKVIESVGIYELTGDTLKVCYSVAPNPRPTDFKAEEKSGRALVIYQRTKP